MQLHTLKRNTPYRPEKRVGRGRASGTGKTAGRGTKGQKARAGHKMWPQIREQLKKLPKRRGYSFRSIARKPPVINVGVLEKYFSMGETVTPKALEERGVLRPGRTSAVKILGEGALTKRLTVEGFLVSGRAREKITQAGGTVVA